MTTILFIHSAGSQDNGEGSSKLLAELRRLLSSDMPIVAPLMPEPDSPDAGKWRAAWDGLAAGESDAVVAVGHSLGGSTILQALAMSGIPPDLRGVITIAAPFWGAPEWDYEDYALPATAGAVLRAIPRVAIMRGDADETVAEDHLERYRRVMPHAELHRLPGVDHEAAGAAAAIATTIREMASR